MTLIPVVERELRVAARHRWTYLGRTLAALGAIVLGSWVAFLARNDNAELARALFATATGTCFGLSLFAGVFFSADSLARERREGTLGLLFLTDLRGLDIALGKLTASSLAAVFCLLAALPILAIPLLLGGVTGAEYFRMVWVLLATQFASLTLGMLASTLASEGRVAGMVTGLLMVGLAGAVPAITGLIYGLVLGWNNSWPDFEFYFGWESPFVAYSLAFDRSYLSHPIRYLGALVFTLVIGVLALAWAARRLPRLGQDSSRKRTSRASDQTNAAQTTATLLQRTAQLELGPLVWFCNRRRIRFRTPWIFLAVSAVIWVAILLVDGSEWNDVPGWIMTSLFLHFFLKLFVASEAPRIFQDERHSGGMELLLSTPLTDAELVHGRLRALAKMFTGPVVATALLDCLFFSASLVGWTKADQSRVEWEVVVLWVCRLPILFVDVAALAWTGTWIGLSSKGHRTALATWARIVVLPVALYLLGVTIIEIIGRISVFSPNGLFTPMTSFALWIALNLAVSGFWWMWSAWRLKVSFRAYATQPPK